MRLRDRSPFHPGPPLGLQSSCAASFTGGSHPPIVLMSSDRLFLERVARQHCPSPLHRHAQINMHSRKPLSKPDISTLRRIGHFYFALTAPSPGCWRKMRMSYLGKVEISY